MVLGCFQPEKSLRTLSILAGACKKVLNGQWKQNKTLLDNFVIFCVPLDKWFFFFPRSSVSLLPHSTDFLKLIFIFFF